jgi:hypothetical protein
VQRGVSLKNLRNLIYNPSKSAFFSPVLVGTISSDQITEYVRRGLPIYDLFDLNISNERSLL